MGLGWTRGEIRIRMGRARWWAQFSDPSHRHRSLLSCQIPADFEGYMDAILPGGYMAGREVIVVRVPGGIWSAKKLAKVPRKDSISISVDDVRALSCCTQSWAGVPLTSSSYLM